VSPSSSSPQQQESITVAGPTLNSRYDREFGIFTENPQCAILVNERGVEVPVRVRLSIIDQVPAGPSKFEVFSPSASSCRFANQSTIVGSCSGSPELPPSKGDPPTGCLLGIKTTVGAGEAYSAKLRYVVTATCVDRSKKPCDELKPSATLPAKITWTYSLKLFACTKDPNNTAAKSCAELRQER
jgi:hypothetical protein